MHLTQHSQTKIALGSDVTLTIVCDATTATVDAIFNELWLAIFRFERQFSRFIPDSELSRFNMRAGTRTPITEAFRNILCAAKKMATETDGLFNPFILPALQRAGYNYSFVRQYTSDKQEMYVNRYVAQPSALEIGKDWATIPYGTAIDLGGCGKGYLADQLAELSIVERLHGFWFSLGGDIRGKGLDEHGQPWVVHIQDAHNPQKSLRRSLLGNPCGFAIASSGTIVRRGNSTNWHHIIDPRSMQPAHTDTLLATVMDTSVLRADVLASCAVILGSQHAPLFFENHPVNGLLLQTTDMISASGDLKHYSKTYIRSRTSDAGTHALSNRLLGVPAV